MERISAAGDVIIEVEPQSWRLLADGNGAERLLVEASPGAPLRYGDRFGGSRQLPPSGELPRHNIQRVVLGWSAQDTSWHLGLVLAGDLVAERGSRWCGLAHWYDPTLNQYEKIATQAGQALAAQTSLPFSVIPPKPEDVSAAAAAAATAPRPPAVEPAPPMTRVITLGEPPPPMPTGAQSYAAPGTPYAQSESEYETPLQPIPQPALPLKFDLWTLQQLDPVRLEFTLSGAWGRSRLLRTAMYIVWLGIFIVLTVTTLTSGIAYPRPEILVYLGIASIIFLVLLILYNLIRVMTATNRIIVEPEGVRWMRGKRVKHAVPADRIAEVYISHVVSKVGKRGKSAEERAVHYGELNLFLTDGDFKTIITQSQFDETIPATDDPINEEQIVGLTPYNARTRLQAAALRLSQVLRVHAEYDKRLK
jgi:Na+-transporting methylmalonyl-CoA/oxaloacetate decarboxylase gamma subunit